MRLGCIHDMLKQIKECLRDVAISINLTVVLLKIQIDRLIFFKIITI